MSSLTLHTYRRCPFAIRVRMVLEEKGLEYTRVEEDLSNLSAELLSLHPEGRVPLLVHEVGGIKNVIYQSTVITEYLDEIFQNQPPLMPPLMPKDPLQRAQVRLFTYWCDQIFKPDLDAFKYELSKLPADDAQALRDRLHLSLVKWDEALKPTGFLVGSQMTLADIHLFPFARQFFRIKPPFTAIENHKHLAAWIEKMTNRPSFDRCMAK